MTSTGVGGLTLGGGSGWLERSLGFTCDNLLGAEMVTASGEVVRASETENADLFWGLKGGGGNFGIVTVFEFRLHPVGPIVLGGLLMWTLDRAPEVMRFYDEFIREAPDRFGGALAFLTAPPAPFVPERFHFKPMVGAIIVWAGPPDEGGRILRPLRKFGRPAVEMVEPMPYTVVQSLLDAGNPHGKPNYWKAAFVKDLTDDAIDVVAERGATRTAPLTVVAVLPLGGAVARMGEDDTPLGHRDAAFDIHILSLWEDPSESDRHIAWTREFADALSPHAMQGVYPNFVGDEGEQMVKTAFGPGKYARLAKLKAAYDPANFFHMNQNIRPAAG